MKVIVINGVEFELVPDYTPGYTGFYGVTPGTFKGYLLKPIVKEVIGKQGVLPDGREIRE